MVRSSQKGASSLAINPSRQRRADTGVWPCTLDGCSKVFAREADLKRHQRTTKSHLVPGSGVGSPCPLCEATFTRTDAMRRHLKSRHNGKTPETLHLPDVPIVPSSSRGKRRACSPSETSELSASDGERQAERQRSRSSSRDPSAAPPYYEQAHPPPPPPNNLSPAILYQAAMSYEIRHALAPSSPTSSISRAHAGPSSPIMRAEDEECPSRSDAYPQPPEHGPFTQFPAEDYAYPNHHSQRSYNAVSHHPPPPFPSGSSIGPIYTNGVYGAGRNIGCPPSYIHPWSPGGEPQPDQVSPDTVKVEDVDTTMPIDRRSGRQGVDHSPRSPFGQREPVPSGLAALAMHAAQIRPMSPLPEAKLGIKTKSELESALGPTYSRMWSYPVSIRICCTGWFILYPLHVPSILLNGALTAFVVCLGAGAVGCFYGSRLHQPEAALPVLVSLVCRSNYAAIKAHGVRLQTRNFGDFVFQPEHTFSSIQAAKGHTWDYVVVTTKALPDVSDDSELIASTVAPRTAIVLIQNGVGVEEPYKRRFAQNPVLSAVTVVSAEQVKPGVVIQNRWTRISIGSYTGGEGDDESNRRTQQFVGLLKQGGIKDAEVYEESALQQVRWHKIAINASMNPSAVLSNGTENARMVIDPELREHLRGCMEEVFYAASVVLGEPLPGHLATAEQILKSTERNTGGRPSMLVDWEKGGQMELEVILGNPIRMARKKGVTMPRLQAMYSLLRMAQARREVKARL
ncbi:2-dehydropantoate 2-reductase [Ramaria rubella]|nr:2-dehydropantoate 2-reductase [Ramaria rubella]